MNFFDLFKADGKTADKKRNMSDPSTNQKLEVYYPTSYKDVEKIIDDLRDGKTVMVHFSKLSEATKLRIIDMLSGAVYALCGGLYETEPNSDIYVFSPSGITVNK